MERSKGETAATSVRISSLESQLQQARATLVSRDSEIQQQKVSEENYIERQAWMCIPTNVTVGMHMQTEVERLQQSDARNSTAIQSLRQQLAEVEERGEGAGQRGLSSELHTEIGRLKTALREKVRRWGIGTEVFIL